jgi:lauroyl/myristoyl acyltransferase
VLGAAVNFTTEDHPLVSWKDPGIAAWLLFLLPLSWSVPERLWDRSSHAIGSFWAGLTPRRTALRIERIERIRLGRSGFPEPKIIDTCALAGNVLTHLQYLREFRPGGWNPRVNLVGREHIDGALAKGAGCIVWVGPFMFSGLVAKKGLHAAGFPITHLSEEFHGISKTRLGRRLLNPVKVTTESRYLSERVVMSRGTELKCIRKLGARLRQNGLVTIACDPAGARRVDRQLLGGRISIASGAPSLALDSGAALLPLFVVRKGPGEFEVVVEHALEAVSSDTRHEAVDDLIGGFVRRIEAFIERHPTSFLWHHLPVDEAPAFSDPSAAAPS